MENVLLIIHLILAVFLIAVVLLQRSEGGALGIGGGGGGGLVTARGAGSALTRVTWILATAFIATSLILTIIAAQNSASRSVLDRLDAPVEGAEDGALPPLALPPADGDGTLAPELERLLVAPPALPGADDDGGAAAPLTPPAAD